MSVDLVEEYEWRRKDLLELHGAGPLISINLLSIPHLPSGENPSDIYSIYRIEIFWREQARKQRTSFHLYSEFKSYGQVTTN